MMRTLAWVASGALGLVLLSGCPDIGGGGGGGGSELDFSSGYTFIRYDDVFAADESSFQENFANLTTDEGGNSSPSISGDGQRVVYVHKDGTSWSLKTVAISGGTAAQTVYAGETGMSAFKSPVFSPDGTRIVFAYEKAGNSHVGVVNSDGSNFLELTDATASVGSPSFYPDGVHVLVGVGSAGGAGFTRLEKLNVDSSAFTSVATSLGGTANAIAHRVVISPDGTKAAFDGKLASNQSISRIFLMNLATSGVSQVTDHVGADATALDTFPTWGGLTTLGFTSNAGGTDNLYEVAVTATLSTGTLIIGEAREGSYGSVP